MPPLGSILLVALVAVGGCQPYRPSFLSRVREDCARGDRWACGLLDSLAHPKPTPSVSSPHAGGDAPPSYPAVVFQLQTACVNKAQSCSERISIAPATLGQWTLRPISGCTTISPARQRSQRNG